MLPPIFTRRISSFLGLSIVVFLAFVVGTITIYQSSKLKALQAETAAWYAQAIATSSATNY